MGSINVIKTASNVIKTLILERISEIGVFYLEEYRMKKRQCRAPNCDKERLTEDEIIKMMRHASYERGSNGRMRSRGGRVAVIR